MTANERSLPGLAERLLRFDTTGGAEADAQRALREFLDAAGFETYEWTADAERLAEHDSFPDDPAEIDAENRPSVAGVLEFGDPDEGPTLVLNGHVDVVPAERDRWETDPFEPTWVERDGERHLVARGAADMKAGLAACVFAVLDVRDAVEAAGGVDGRLVVESVAGEEEGGIGAAAATFPGAARAGPDGHRAAGSVGPYPFERDAALVAEPTDLTPVVATEGTVMKRLRIEGRSAHAATRWVGESVLPHFERIRRAFEALEAERGESVVHPLYEDYPVPWPVCVGRVEAGSWASTVPASLTAELRIGVAPGESVAAVETAFEERLAEVVEHDEWLAAHPPSFERFSIQFEPAETDPDAPVVESLRAAMAETGLADDEPRGATYGADSRYYVAAGIPTVVFGPGTVERAHFPNESVAWADVERARETLAAFVRRYLSSK